MDCEHHITSRRFLYISFTKYQQELGEHVPGLSYSRSSLSVLEKNEDRCGCRWEQREREPWLSPSYSRSAPLHRHPQAGSPPSGWELLFSMGHFWFNGDFQAEDTNTPEMGNIPQVGCCLGFQLGPQESCTRVGNLRSRANEYQNWKWV